MVVVVKRLLVLALTQRLRMEEQTVKGKPYVLDHAMKRDVLVINKLHGDSHLNETVNTKLISYG